MRTFHHIVTYSVIVVAVVVVVLPQTRSQTGPAGLSVAGINGPRGLCRDGWTSAATHDMLGREVAFCIKVNRSPLSWTEARSRCRAESGFLLKLESPISLVSGVDLLNQLLTDGITNIWSGLHTEYNHLVWDDITPCKVSANSRGNTTEWKRRPWTFANSDFEKREDYCGKLDVRNTDTEDDRKKKRRKKRAPEDTTDTDLFSSSSSDVDGPATGTSHSAQAQLRRAGFSRPNFGTGPLETGAFQSALTRTQMSAFLEQLPGRSLGIKSKLQQPGAGLPDSNIEQGGLVTGTLPLGLVTPEPGAMPTVPDSDSDSHADSAVKDLIHDAAKLGQMGNTQRLSNRQHGLNNQDTSSHHVPTPPLDLIQAVKDHAEKFAKPGTHLPTTSSSDIIDNLKDHLTERIGAPPSKIGFHKSDGLGALSQIFRNGNQGRDNGMTLSPDFASELMDKATVEKEQSDLLDFPKDIIDHLNSRHDAIPDTTDAMTITKFSGTTARPFDIIGDFNKETTPRSIGKMAQEWLPQSSVGSSSDGGVDTLTEKINDEQMAVSDSPDKDAIDQHTGILTDAAYIPAPIADTSLPDTTPFLDGPELSDIIGAFSDTVDNVNLKTSDITESTQGNQVPELSGPEREDRPTNIRSAIADGVRPDTINSMIGSGDEVMEHLTESFGNIDLNNPMVNSKSDDSKWPSSNDNPLAESAFDSEQPGTGYPRPTETLSEDTDGTVSKANGEQVENPLLEFNNFKGDPSSVLDKLIDQISTHESDSFIDQETSQVQINDESSRSHNSEGGMTMSLGESPVSGRLSETKGPATTDENEEIVDVREESQVFSDMDGGIPDSLTENVDEHPGAISESKSTIEISPNNPTLIDSITSFEGDTVRVDDSGSEAQDESEMQDDVERITDDGASNEINMPSVESDIETDPLDTEGDITLPVGAKMDENIDSDISETIGVEIGSQTEEDDMETVAGDQNGAEIESDENSDTDMTSELHPLGTERISDDAEEDVSDDEYRPTELQEEPLQDSLGDIDDLPDMAEAILPGAEKAAISPRKKPMALSDCETELPSVCFTYQIQVSGTASTCEDGWYGHVFVDTCYKFLDLTYNFMASVQQCREMGSNVVGAATGFEQKFVLLAAEKAGKPRGKGYWYASLPGRTCNYFDEAGVKIAPCQNQLNVVCAKPAKDSGTHLSEETDIVPGNTPVSIKFSVRGENNVLPCGIESDAYELPVLWFKDGVLVDSRIKDETTAVSSLYGKRGRSGETWLSLDNSLLQTLSRRTKQEQNLSGLQGEYWCQVWDAKRMRRRTFRPFTVRFTDVMSFHGSMKLDDFSLQEELLFSMTATSFPHLSKVTTDLKKVFSDVIPLLRKVVPFVTSGFTEVDKVRSDPGLLEFHTYITLTKDFSSNDEETVLNTVKGLLRATLDKKRYLSSLPENTSLATFRTMSVQSTLYCSEASLHPEVVEHAGISPLFSTLTFPRTPAGSRSDSQESCGMASPVRAGRASCLGNFYTGVYWSEVVHNECPRAPYSPDSRLRNPSPFTEKLLQMALTEVTDSNVQEMMDDVLHITETAAWLAPTDINKIADVLDHSTKLDKLSVKVGEDVVKTIDKLMEVSQKEVQLANDETMAANRIIKSLERYAEKADLEDQTNMRMVTNNVVVEIWTLEPKSRPVIGLAARSDNTKQETPFEKEHIVTIFNQSQLYTSEVDAAIELPFEIYEQNLKDVTTKTRLTMMVFRKSKLFEAAAISGEGVAVNTKSLNSYIISASIAGKTLTNLQHKVKTVFRPLKESSEPHSCVFWDFSKHKGKGGWSDRGCYYDGRINGRDVCLCDHLTNFAVLLDFYGQKHKIPDHHELSLSIITVIGLSLSILGLALTIISYMFFRKLRHGRAQQTLFNLALALLCSNLVFLTGVKQTHTYIGCLVVAVLLHFFILASFMWMLMEAILQYLTFVKVLGTYITRFTMKTVLPAWGLPLIPVVSILTIDYDLYRGGPDYCWMDLPAFYFGFAIPVSAIILINIVIFLVTIVSISRRGQGLRSNQKKQKIAMTNLQAAITSFILLGLTWLFGYLAISDARLPFQYVFTVLNSLQGFFIFVLFVLRKKKVREQWYIICCMDTDKDRVSRSLSASNSIPSSYSNGSCRGADRDRSDSTKTTSSTFSGYSNQGYEENSDGPPIPRRMYKNV